MHPLLFGQGIAPISDVVQLPQATELVYPMTKYSSKYNEKFTEVVLEDEYEQFLNRYEKVVLIAFGTSFIPKRDELLKLIEVTRD